MLSTESSVGQDAHRARGSRAQSSRALCVRPTGPVTPPSLPSHPFQSWYSRQEQKTTSTSSVVVFHKHAHAEHRDRSSGELRARSQCAADKRHQGHWQCLQYVLDEIHTYTKQIIKFIMWTISFVSLVVSVPSKINFVTFKFMLKFLAIRH